MSQRDVPDEPTNAASAEVSSSRHFYICTASVAGCTTYVVGRQYELVVSDPPPDPYVLPGPGPCAGAQFMLDE